MYYKLKDYQEVINRDLPQGYCEDCYPEGSVIEPYYTLVDENNNEYVTPAFSWWGTTNEVETEFDSLPLFDDQQEFSEWLEKTDIFFPEDHNYDWFYQVYWGYSTRLSYEENHQLQQWVDKNVKVDKNTILIYFNEENKEALSANQFSIRNILEKSSVHLPRYFLFNPIDNDLVDFQDEIVYAF